MAKMKIKKGDTVRIITGKDKGKEGKVLVTDSVNGRVVVEGVSMVTKHQRNNGMNQGGIVHKEAPIHVSNVMLVVGGKTTRVGVKVEKGETKEQALIRECKEELNITIKPKDVFMEVVHEYSDITVHLTLFNAEIVEGVPQKLEHNDIKWIRSAEMHNYTFCPADEQIIRKLLINTGDKKI